MALTDQPYIPFFVDDWMNNLKLKQCSPGAHGVMITVMCIMHKEDTYGKILLRQKFKQSDKQIKNFAAMLAKFSSFFEADFERFLSELIDEKVLLFEGDYLVCNRMVKDSITSKNRIKSGKKGGRSTANYFAIAKVKANKQANVQANTVIETEHETAIETENENAFVIEGGDEIGDVPEPSILSEEYIKEPFKLILGKWLAYKKGRNEPYQTPEAIKLCYEALMLLSNNSPGNANLIIKDAMANNYGGFFGA